MEQPKQISIQPNDEFNIVITGADYIAIDAAIKKLPYEVAVHILKKLEQQIIDQKNG